MINFKEIYELLDKVNPIDSDCGLLCGAACCQQDASEEDLGIYLLPGEASVHDKSDSWLDWSEEDPEESGFPESWTDPVDFVVCHGPKSCKRWLRPIQCRTFPLEPHLTEDGKLFMIVNSMELPYACPLVDEYTKIDSEFVDVTKKAWSRLIQDQRIYDLVYEDSRYRDEDGVEYIMAM